MMENMEDKEKVVDKGLLYGVGTASFQLLLSYFPFPSLDGCFKDVVETGVVVV